MCDCEGQRGHINEYVTDFAKKNIQKFKTYGHRIYSLVCYIYLNIIRECRTVRISILSTQNTNVSLSSAFVPQIWPQVRVT